MDILIVIIVVALAAGYLYHKFYRAFKADQPSCGCGCSGCSSNTMKKTDKGESS